MKAVSAIKKWFGNKHSGIIIINLYSHQLTTDCRESNIFTDGKFYL